MTNVLLYSCVNTKCQVLVCVPVCLTLSVKCSSMFLSLSHLMVGLYSCVTKFGLSYCVSYTGLQVLVCVLVCSTLNDKRSFVFLCQH